MATYVSGVERPTGGLSPWVKMRLQCSGPIVALHDGWHTATALALYHLAEAECREVLILSHLPRRCFKLPSGWELQEPGLISPISRCTKALWLGQVAPLGYEALWPCFTDRRKSLPYHDKGPDLDPEYPDYSGLRPERLDQWLRR